MGDGWTSCARPGRSSGSVPTRAATGGCWANLLAGPTLPLNDELLACPAFDQRGAEASTTDPLGTDLLGSSTPTHLQGTAHQERDTTWLSTGRHFSRPG